MFTAILNCNLAHNLYNNYIFFLQEKKMNRNNEVFSIQLFESRNKPIQIQAT